MDKRFVFGVGLALPLVGMFAVQAGGEPAHYESYFLYLGDYPGHAEPGWQEDVQGVTHDESCWYITQGSKRYPSDRALWRIPVGHDLSSVSHDDAGVTRRLIDDVPDLAEKGYWHFSDLDHYEYKGNGYLLIAVEGDATPVLAVFRANASLDYLGCAEVEEQATFPWVAVDPCGCLYTCESGTVTTFQKYTLQWDALDATGAVDVNSIGSLVFSDEAGGGLALKSTQGGVFSESGRLLYVVCGYMDYWHPSYGINVFDTATWRRVAHSERQRGHFKCEFHPTCDFPNYICQEAEGITIWDLDDGRAPNISGQLHVFVLENDEATKDDVWFKHYTHTINVDSAYSGLRALFTTPSIYKHDLDNGVIPGAIKAAFAMHGLPLTESATVIKKDDEWLIVDEGFFKRFIVREEGNSLQFWQIEEYGTLKEPFNTVGEASNLAWDGSRIRIKGGSYPESITFSKRMQLLTRSGTATLGRAGRISLTPSGTISIYDGGILTVH
jgi:hypothetical protein